MVMKSIDNCVSLTIFTRMFYGNVFARDVITDEWFFAHWNISFCLVQVDLNTTSRFHPYQSKYFSNINEKISFWRVCNLKFLLHLSASSPWSIKHERVQPNRRMGPIKAQWAKILRPPMPSRVNSSTDQQIIIVAHFFRTFRLSPARPNRSDLSDAVIKNANVIAALMAFPAFETSPAEVTTIICNIDYWVRKNGRMRTLNCL